MRYFDLKFGGPTTDYTTFMTLTFPELDDSKWLVSVNNNFINTEYYLQYITESNTIGFCCALCLQKFYCKIRVDEDQKDHYGRPTSWKIGDKKWYVLDDEYEHDRHRFDNGVETNLSEIKKHIDTCKFKYLIMDYNFQPVLNDVMMKAYKRTASVYDDRGIKRYHIDISRRINGGWETERHRIDIPNIGSPYWNTIHYNCKHCSYCADSYDNRYKTHGDFVRYDLLEHQRLHKPDTTINNLINIVEEITIKLEKMEKQNRELVKNLEEANKKIKMLDQIESYSKVDKLENKIERLEYMIRNTEDR
jgi:hypothetical protein